jgi:hypothetical protein
MDSAMRSIAAGLALCFLSTGGPPVARVLEGEARAALAERVLRLAPKDGGLALAGPGWVELAAGSRLELLWRGLGGATLTGPAALELGRAPGLAFAHFTHLELEVRRGPFRLELAGAGTLELESGVLRARAVPEGVELLNRGGAELVVRAGDGRRVRIPAGGARRLARAATP